MFFVSWQTNATNRDGRTDGFSEKEQTLTDDNDSGQRSRFDLNLFEIKLLNIDCVSLVRTTTSLLSSQHRITVFEYPTL